MVDIQQIDCPQCHCILGLFPCEAKVEFRQVSYLKNRLICTQGERIQDILVLCRGVAQTVRRSVGVRKSAHIPLDSGTVIGYQELMNGQVFWSHSIKALEHCQVIEINPEVFFDHLERNFTISLTLMRQSIRRSHNAHLTLAQLLKPKTNGLSHSKMSFPFDDGKFGIKR